MDAIEDDPRYPRNSYSLNNYGSSSSNPRRARTRDPQFTRPIPNFYDKDELDELDEEIDHQKENPNGYNRNLNEDDDFPRHPKKRRMKNLASAYEFAPRVNPSYSVRSSRVEEEGWAEHGMFVLLEVWGERFLQLGRKSLRSEDWEEVAERVSEASKIERTETQCRNMLDSLKKRYKKEKLKMEPMGLKASKWGLFKKMDMLMASSPRQDYGLACGVDSGEFVFMNTRVYLDRSNGYDEMRDSPIESETSEEEFENGDDSDGFTSRRNGKGGRDWDKGSKSFRVLADSIQKFGEIYGKIESSKRQQMMELEKMRKDFCKELELQKKQIMERTEAEIAKIREEEEEDDDDNDDEEEEETSATPEDLSE